MADSSLAIDCHAHCYDLGVQGFGPSSGFHVQDNELGSAGDFAAVLDAHGISHAVLVNPLGGYGTDNTYLLRVLAAAKGRFRGIALLAGDADDRDVAALVEGGVAGIRFNLNFPTSPSLFGATGQRALAIARAAGWVIQIHYSGDTIIPALPILRQSGCRVVIDHCGRPDIGAGINQRGFAELLEYGREGTAFIKLSGFFRMTANGPPYRECDPYARALIDAFTPDRCLWGSDWPFIRIPRRVDYGPQLACLGHLVPDADDHHRILWTTPAALFGFTAAHDAT